MPMAGWPSAEIAAANFLFSKRANTMTATSRVSRSVTPQAGNELAFDSHALEGGG